MGGAVVGGMVLLTVLPGCVSKPAPTTGSVTGQVEMVASESAVAPAVGVTVAIGEKSVVTADNGAFTLTEVPTGSATIVVSGRDAGFYYRVAENQTPAVIAKEGTTLTEPIQVQPDLTEFTDAVGTFLAALEAEDIEATMGCIVSDPAVMMEFPGTTMVDVTQARVYFEDLFASYDSIQFTPLSDPTVVAGPGETTVTVRLTGTGTGSKGTPVDVYSESDYSFKFVPELLGDKTNQTFNGWKLIRWEAVGGIGF